MKHIQSIIIVILTEIKWRESFHSQKTPHISPWWVSYGLWIVGIFKIFDCVITASHCCWFSNCVRKTFYFLRTLSVITLLYPYIHCVFTHNFWNYVPCFHIIIWAVARILCCVCHINEMKGWWKCSGFAHSVVFTCIDGNKSIIDMAVVDTPARGTSMQMVIYCI